MGGVKLRAFAVTALVIVSLPAAAFVDHDYSITSSARASSVGGTSRPSATSRRADMTEEQLHRRLYVLLAAMGEL
jgi:hypothetical protein